MGTVVQAFWINSVFGLPFQEYKEEKGNPQSLQGNRITACTPAQDGKWWIATDKGLNLFDPQDQTAIFRPIPIMSYTVCQDGPETLWYAGWQAGLFRFDMNTEKAVHYPTLTRNADDKIIENVNNILKTQSGTLWVGTYDNGLFRYQRETDRFVRYPSDGSYLRVTCLFEDKTGQIMDRFPVPFDSL